nr:ABC transporter G family member 23-like [Leptinotarsa decemlineata]
MHDNYAVYVENVVKNYGNKTILKELNMKVERGIIYGLLGASGCGKTTLLSSIVGRKKIDGGEIWVLGGKPGEVGSGVPGPRVGYMPQDIALVGEFTVKDAIYYFGRIFGMEESLIAERYKNLHNLLELPPDDRYLKNCSGGQQRRVSLAASLVHKPELLIMDEPTVGVDPVLRDKIWNHLVEITKKENTSVIITTHYIEEARQANKVGLMREGKLLVEESPSRLLTIFNTATLEEVFLILSRRQEEGRLENIDQQAIADDQNNSIVPFNHISGSAVSVASVSTFEVGHGSTDMLAKEKLRKAKHAINRNRVKALMDKNWKQFYRNVTLLENFQKMNQNIAVHVKGVRKRLGKLQVLEGVDMEVEKGTIYGLLGASGCGKTTLLNILVGRIKLDEGEVSVLGNEYTGRQSNVLGSRVGYMPQEVALVESLTVKDTLFYFGRIYGMSDKLITERYDELHTLLELPPDNRYIVDCSGGEKRRVSFASAVIHKPELLILDEPTVGVDPLLRERIWNYLVDMTKKLGTSVIITTHYIEECRQTDRICLLRGGIILAQENPDRLLAFYNSQTLEDVFLMLSKEQDEGRLSVTRGDMLPPQDNESIASGKVTTFEINDGPEIPDKKRGVKQANGSISKRRISAMLDKNWKQFYRNRTGFLFFFFIPLSQTFFCLAGVGGNVKNIPLGIVNDEVEDCSFVSNFDDSSCRFSNMSCRFLTHLNHPMISKVKCDSLEDAIENVRRGVTAGALYIPENFSSLVEQRMDTGLIFDDDVVGDLSQVKVWMDMSNMEIGESVKYKLIELFKDFQVSVLKDCGYPPEFGDVPIKMNLIFGHDQEAFTVFMIPGVMISILFLFGSIITCQIIVTEREEGIWDRSIVAGVTSLEITVSHLVLQACLALIPVIEILCLIFWIYQYTNVGSYWLLFLILYLTELSGMCYGYLVSIVSNGHIMATLFLCGSINTMILICGMIWPVEGMHSFLRLCTKFLPFSFSIEATRNVIRKGWTIDNLQVFDGILVALLWIVIIAVISVFLMKRGR